jgi:arginase family enzyme
VVEPAHRFLGGSPWSAAEKWDVVVVGVPHDAGSLASSNAKKGPSHIRRVSAVMSPAGHRRADGWYDFAADRSILAGLRLADFGDLALDPLALGPDLALLPRMFGELRDTCELLLVLGGDDSLAYWACRHSGADVLVHLDAHEDATALAGPYPRHNNFVSYLERDEPDLAILQFGQRDLVPGAPGTPGPGRRRCRSPEELRRELAARDGARIALSLDIDVLDPRLMPSVTNPVPGGLHPGDVLAVAETAAASGGRVRQLTLTEFAPAEPTALVDAVTVTHLLMRAVHACLH